MELQVFVDYGTRCRRVNRKDLAANLCLEVLAWTRFPLQKCLQSALLKNQAMFLTSD